MYVLLYQYVRFLTQKKTERRKKRGFDKVSWKLEHERVEIKNSILSPK